MAGFFFMLTLLALSNLKKSNAICLFFINL